MPDPGYSYVAARPLYIGFTRAFNPGQAVPDSTVTAQGWVVGTDVVLVGTPLPLPPTSLMLWQPYTFYPSGTLTVNSSGQIVSANTTHTSGASYSAANWTIVNDTGSSSVAFTTLETYGGGTGVTDNTAAFAAAWAVADQIQLGEGTYQVAGSVVAPRGSCSIVGRGNATIIKLTAAAAGLVFKGSGGGGRYFQINGNAIATTALLLGTRGTVGPGDNQEWTHVTVTSAAGTNWFIGGLQNTVFTSCQASSAGGNNLIIDYGAGGLHFTRFESVYGGNSNLLIQQTPGGAAASSYTIPTDIGFDQCIFELLQHDDATHPLTYLSASSGITFENCQWSTSGNNSTAPLILIDGYAKETTFSNGSYYSNLVQPFLGGAGTQTTYRIVFDGITWCGRGTALIDVANTNYIVTIAGDIAYATVPGPIASAATPVGVVRLVTTNQRGLIDVTDWAALTKYTQGAFTLSPVGAYVAGQKTIVQALVAFTSGAAFNAGNWRRITEQLSPADLRAGGSSDLSATAVPVALGPAAVGAGTGFDRSGHVHPTTGLVVSTDGRLTDSRTPLDGSVSTVKIATGGVAQSAVTGLPAALTAKADLVGGVVPTAQIPALALVTSVVVASQAAMLALTTTQVQPGDLAIRTDGAGTFILTADDPSVLASWTRLNAPTDVVTTVNGQVGTVVLAASDVGAQPADSDLTAIAALSTTAFGRSSLDRVDAPAARALLALGTAATADKVAAGTAGVLDATDGTTTNARAPILTRSIISASAPPIAKVGNVTIAASGAGIPGQMVAYNSTSAVNDSMTHRGDVGPGTWTLRAWHGKQSNGGIINIDYSLDEGVTWVSVAAALDLYSAATVTSFVDKTGIVVTTQSTIRVRWTVTGKNASSSANLYFAGQVDLVRTS